MGNGSGIKNQNYKQNKKGSVKYKNKLNKTTKIN
jgi:hypothetical protein